MSEDKIQIVLTEEEVKTLLKHRELIDKQAINAAVGKQVSAEVIGINIDRLVEIIEEGDDTGQFARIREEHDAQRRSNAIEVLKNRM